MKILIKKRNELIKTGRWDIDFHLPPVEIAKFPAKSLVRIGDLATFPKEKRDPCQKPEELFQYIDISCVDVATGLIQNPQELLGEEAPSRARKVVNAFDIVVSTCRPTRGAIAIVPVALHNQIASTGFSVLRTNVNVNPFYLHYALRLPSTLEQFRKWSTGSSYPAILDEDVSKTLIPVPDAKEQDRIALMIMKALHQRDLAILEADQKWNSVLIEISNSLRNLNDKEESGQLLQNISKNNGLTKYSIAEVQNILNSLNKPLKQN